MPSQKFDVGQRVSWRMQDGKVMTGEVIFVNTDTLLVIRPDGGTAIVPDWKCKLSTNEEWRDSISVFEKKK